MSHQLITYPSSIPPQHSHGCWVAARPFCFLDTASHRDIPTPGTSPVCHYHRASQGHQGEQTQSLTMHPARD